MIERSGREVIILNLRWYVLEFWIYLVIDLLLLLIYELDIVLVYDNYFENLFYLFLYVVCVYCVFL